MPCHFSAVDAPLVPLDEESSSNSFLGSTHIFPLCNQAWDCSAATAASEFRRVSMEEDEAEARPFGIRVSSSLSPAALRCQGA